MLITAALLDAPADPSGRGLLVVVTAVLVLAVAAVHVRLLLRAAPREPVEQSTPSSDRQATGGQQPLEPVDAGRR